MHTLTTHTSRSGYKLTFESLEVSLSAGAWKIEIELRFRFYFLEPREFPHMQKREPKAPPQTSHGWAWKKQFGN